MLDPQKVRLAAITALALACICSRVSDAKCLIGDAGEDRRYGPVVVLSPQVPNTSDENARVQETRQLIRRLLISLRRTQEASKAGYAPKWSSTTAGYIYVPRTPQAGGVISNADHNFNILQPAELIYSKPPSDFSQLIGARYTFSGFTDFAQLDREIPLNLARWKQTRHRCMSPAGLVSLPWSVEVFPFVAAHP